MKRLWVLRTLLIVTRIVISRAKWVEPVKVQLNDELIMYSSPPPGSGVLTAYILNILDTFLLEDSSGTNPLTYHRIAEAFKYAYAQRS